jgi:hypothetical protein
MIVGMNVYHNTFFTRIQEPEPPDLTQNYVSPPKQKNEDAEMHQPPVANSNPNLAWCFKHTTS